MSQDEPSQRIVTIRPRAVADIERHAEYLEENASPEVAWRFRSAVMEAVEQIGFMPGAGAHREVRNPALSGLRMWIIPGFRNHLIFYLTPEGRAEIIRVFHAAQDIKTLLEEEPGEQNGDV